ncbi:MAG: hypothetical protein AAFP69_23445 [Planctomycetota bacterium]
MLGIDYSERLDRLITSVSWDIVLPDTWSHFFEISGPDRRTAKIETRRSNRVAVRGRGILYHETALPCFPRDQGPVGVFTRDFSGEGCGLITPYQMWPEETVRLLLPTFWLQLKITRTRRLTEDAYEAGAKILAKHE